MRRLALISVAAAAGMAALASGGVTDAGADEIPDLCVYARVSATTSTTLKVDTTGSTCGLPPNPASPCPGGIGRTDFMSQMGYEVETLVCVRDI